MYGKRCNKYEVKNVGIYFQKLFLWSEISPIRDTEGMSFLTMVRKMYCLMSVRYVNSSFSFITD